MFKRFLPRPNLNTLCFILILVLAAVLRFYCLSCSSLWHDEGNTWALMDRSFAGIARAAAADIHPPGYYWLLKVWTTLFGTDVAGLRSFSVVAGVLTVVVVYAIGKQAVYVRRLLIADYSSSVSMPVFPLLATFLAAVNPFQIYYSQEARQYALLALLSAILFWAVIASTEYGIRKAESHNRQGTTHSWPFAPCVSAFVIFFFAAVSGLWTHYTFPIVLVAAGLAYLWYWFRAPVLTEQLPGVDLPEPGKRKCLLPFIVVNGLVVLAFLPWLPTSIERVFNWPAGRDVVSFGKGLQLALQTLAVGPIRTGPALDWPWLLLVGSLPLLGIWTLRRSVIGVTLGLWLLAPILLMFGLGLFTEAFLKFLLIASPAWSLLVAAAFAQHSVLRLGAIPVFLLSVVLALVTLPHYYTDVRARDNYAGIARTVAALGDPTHDLVILDAPGQQEVWRYYDPGLPVLALPQQRPADIAATEALLAEAVANRRQLFTIFWALDEADPERIVERWLDQHAFKGLESWQGNVRFVFYSLANDLTCNLLSPGMNFGDFAQLSETCQPADGWFVSPGETVILGLRWRSLRKTDRHYKVTLQLLDSRDQLIAQRDSEPGGGSYATPDWQPEQSIEDNHALFIPPGTPPGNYHLILALYDAETGERLTVSGGDTFSVGTVTVSPGDTLPVEIVPIQHRINRSLGSVRLLGYDAYRRGYAHAPETPMSRGDILHVTLYWQAPNPLPADWPSDLSMTLSLGDESLTAPLAGGIYPTADWPAGALVRGEFDIPYTGQQPRLSIQSRNQRLRLGRIPVQ